MRMGPVLKYPGSKYTIAAWIVNHMPSHQVYLDPYFGSGGVFFAKPPVKVETINDIDGHVINLFRVIREQPEQLAQLVHWTPWAREEYQELLTTASNKEYFKKTGNPLEDARRLLIRLWMAHGGKTSDRTGWRHNVQAKVGNSCAKVWHDIPERILITAQRLKDAQIECRPALELIVKYRYSEVLIYADPPYVLDTRRRMRQYKHEMTNADHIALIDTLNAHPGPVLLSGYACPLYDRQLRRWERKTCSALAEGGRKREEVLWLNQIAVKALDQQTLFKKTRGRV